MKHTINLSGRLQSTDSELPITHCLVGRRSEQFDAPPKELLDRAVSPKPEPPLTSEESMQVRIYKEAFIDGRGKYALNALAWVESEEDGKALKARFSDPEWQQDSLALIPV